MLFSTSTSSTGQHTVSNFPHWFRFSGRDLCMFLPVCCSRNRHYNGTVIENHLSVEKMGVIIGQSLHLSCYGVWLLPLRLVWPQLKAEISRVQEWISCLFVLGLELDVSHEAALSSLCLPVQNRNCRGLWSHKSPHAKGQFISKSRLTSRRSSQKTNGQIWLPYSREH